MDGNEPRTDGLIFDLDSILEVAMFCRLIEHEVWKSNVLDCVGKKKPIAS